MFFEIDVLKNFVIFSNVKNFAIFRVFEVFAVS